MSNDKFENIEYSKQITYGSGYQYFYKVNDRAIERQIFDESKKLRYKLIYTDTGDGIKVTDFYYRDNNNRNYRFDFSRSQLNDGFWNLATYENKRKELIQKSNSLTNNFNKLKNQVINDPIPSNLTNWFFKDKKENYQAIQSIKFAERLGRELRSGNGFTEDRIAGIRYLNSLVETYDNSLNSLEDKVSESSWISKKSLKMELLEMKDMIRIDNDILGDWGEEQVAENLMSYDGGSKNQLLTDILIPYGYNGVKTSTKTTQIDTIYISRHGIHLLEVKTRKSIKDVSLSSSGDLVINGHDPQSENPLLKQVRIHKRAISNFLEESDSSEIKTMLDSGKLPITTVVVLVSGDSNNDYQVDYASFNRHKGIKAVKLIDLYDEIFESNGVVMTQDETNAVYNEFLNKCAFNQVTYISRGNIRSRRQNKSGLIGKSYEHILFFRRADWFGNAKSGKYNFTSYEDVKKDFSKYIIDRTAILNQLSQEISQVDEISEKIDNTDRQKELAESIKPSESLYNYITHPIEEIAELPQVPDKAISTMLEKKCGKPVSDDEMEESHQQKPTIVKEKYTDKVELDPLQQQYFLDSVKEKPSSKEEPSGEEGFFKANRFLLVPFAIAICVALGLAMIAHQNATSSSTDTVQSKKSSTASSTEPSQESNSASESSSTSSDDERVREIFAGKIYEYNFSFGYKNVSLNGKDFDFYNNNILESVDMMDDNPYYLVFSKDSDEVVISQNKVDAIKYQRNKNEFESAYKEQTKSGKQFYKVANHGLNIQLQNVVFVDDNSDNEKEIKFSQNGIDKINELINHPVKDGYVETGRWDNSYSWDKNESLDTADFDSSDSYSAYIRLKIELSEFNPD